ncbi:MAG: hypothetical protein ACYTET_06990 [Planctomycetota bacterium]
MKTISICVVLSLIWIAGCRDTKTCSVKSYGSEYLVVSGNQKLFHNACRTVINELSYKEKNDDNRTSYPHYAAGNRTEKNQDGSLIASSSYMKTKDSEGYEYTIKTIHLSGKDPLVIVETTNPEKYILFNALCKELHKNDIPVLSQ